MSQTIDLNVLADLFTLIPLLGGLAAYPLWRFDRRCQREERDRMASVRAYVANRHYERKS
ncbi:hypothetical protein [Croceicoccus naphthovorans]|uniref:Uncharacterized protein n=1 Tax=Croceicoccus naphthovorans TaxID=1348774 RepID=A0A0G3XCU0_9SPHN|nr:hypothetical protein [Croceicoccus naphthovorans]AKM09375.1 hypothetical protein AB433_04250 [Croceicoccus naphthovorans]MBB3990299.1 hypothetical protein [Croceicoccus naphthovorans]